MNNNKMQIKLNTIQFIIISFTLFNFSTGQLTSASLFDLPWTFDKGNWTIYATLTNEASGEVFYVQENVQVTENVRGKITINGLPDKESADIFYSSVFNQKLVIKDNHCDPYNFNNGWDKKLSDSIEPLLNQLLLTGPSILFRLNAKNLIWAKGPDTIIRGFNVHSASATLTDSTNITYYYKASEQSKGLLGAIRLKLDGYSLLMDPYDKESVFIDIYSITKVDENFEPIVTVTPGIGCPDYLNDARTKLIFSFPYLKAMKLHYFEKVAINGLANSNTYNEVYIDSENGIAKVKTTHQGVTSELLYDYKLRIIYSREEGKSRCQLSSMDPNGVGIESIYDGSYQLYELLDMDANQVFYIGQRFYADKSSILTRVWEYVLYDYELNGKRFDKVIKTHYFIPYPKAIFFNKHILASTHLNAYIKTTNNSYQLIETIKRDYYDFYQANSESEYDIEFHAGDCYPNPKDRKTLALQFECKGSGDTIKRCMKNAKRYLNQFRQNLKISIAKKFISIARISDVDIVFAEDDKIIAYVTILRVPELKVILKSVPMMIAADSISSASVTQVSFEVDCLDMEILKTPNFEAIIYCDQQSSMNICGRVEKESLIKVDPVNGLNCKVYHISGEIFQRHSYEIPLDKVTEHLQSTYLAVPIDYGFGLAYDYMMKKVTDVTPEVDQAITNLFTLAAYELKLIEDTLEVTKDTIAKDIGDCYRTCSSSANDKCETFSFCQYTDKVSCLTSSIAFVNSSNGTIKDSSCKIYSKNHLSDYIKIPSRKFTNSQSTVTDHNLGECANRCSVTDKCVAFQQCGGTCVTGGQFTDSSTTYSDECDIYSLSNRYRATGRNLVSQVLYTELNLNMDQCAALCYSWTDGDVKCNSFNFCHKSLSSSTSTCGLTNYMIKDESTNSTYSETCQNYEFIGKEEISKSSDNPSGEMDSSSGTRVGSAIGIIILFLGIGLVAGFTIPKVISKMKSTIRV